MSPFDLPILVTFWLLISLNIFSPRGWQLIRQKSRTDWILDLCGLGMQGVVIPGLQIGLLYQSLHWLIPHSEHCLNLPPLVGFLLCTVLVDYGYYWNHRWLHAGGWPIHSVHHTVTQLDVWGTSRNSLWSSFFILYLWIHTVMLYLLRDPSGYLWGISLTAMLDLWRHSRFSPVAGSWFYQVLSPWLVLPQDHAWHHAQQERAYNFGANLKVWDRLHGTAWRTTCFPKQLGMKTSLTFWQKLLYPFETS